MVPWWDCDTVYCGFWSNESNHPVLRGTLTLPSQWGLVLVGFFTLLITIISGYLWGTIAFVTHQINSSSKPQDDTYHQMQLILRNTESEGSFVSHMTRVAWKHRHGRPKVYRRSIFMIILAGLYGILFALVGGFSSGIIAARDQSMLSVERNCGWFHEPTYLNPAVPTVANIYSISGVELFDYINAMTVTLRNAFRRSAAYSRSCYRGFNETSTACDNLVQPTLPYTVRRQVPCPFEDKICNGTAISLDTGNLRSDVHLGVNTRPEDAMSVRKVLTCVPLAGESYTSGWQQISPDMADGWLLPPDTKVKAYAFGPRVIGWGLHVGGPNYTAALDEVSWVHGVQPYSLQISNAILDMPWNPVWNQFIPISDLKNMTADTTVIGLINRNKFGSSIADPWFRADNCTLIPDRFPPLTCQAPSPLSFLGCQEQYQFCKVDSTHPDSTSSYETTGSDSCTPLTGLYKLFPDLLLVKGSPWNGTVLSNLNPVQKALYHFLARTMSGSQLHWQLGFIGNENLVAQEVVWDGGFEFDMSASLPSDQWEIEVMNWLNVSLSNTQRAAVAYSRPSQYEIGSSSNTSLQYIEDPQDPELRSLCSKIKVRSAQHTSFSTIGMAATIAFGLACILGSYAIRPLFTWIQHRSGHGTYKSQEWTESSTFQLQRMAADGKGIGPWKDKEGDIPTLVDPELRFRLVGDRQYGNVESTTGSNYGYGAQYQPLNKQVNYREDEVDPQGFVELRHLGGRAAYSP